MDMAEHYRAARRASKLPMDKLYRKRAVDRENQRALRYVRRCYCHYLLLICARERKKLRVVELEDELKDLKDKLEHAESAKCVLETREIQNRARLQNIITSLQHLQDPEGETRVAPQLVRTSNNNEFDAANQLVETNASQIPSTMLADGTPSVCVDRPGTVSLHMDTTSFPFADDCEHEGQWCEYS